MTSHDIGDLRERFMRTLNSPYYDEGAEFVAAELIADVVDWLAEATS